MTGRQNRSLARTPYQRDNAEYQGADNCGDQNRRGGGIPRARVVANVVCLAGNRWLASVQLDRGFNASVQVSDLRLFPLPR